MIGYVITIGVGTLFALPFSKSLQAKKSYIEIYDTHIAGFSIPKRYFSDSACTFTLDYSDITHISTQKHIVEIHFSGGSYLVQAYEAEQQVIAIIKQQQAKAQQQS